MANTTVTTFFMPAFAQLKAHKTELFVFFFALYITTIVLNVSLITIISKNKNLHQPMNIFSCLLAINEIYGSTALIPNIMVLLLSESVEVAVQRCFAQVFFLHTYAAAEFCILAVMGYDRYTAICHPLHYHSIMSNSRLSKLIALTLLYPFILFLIYFSLTLDLKLCGNIIPKLYCVNMELVKNACSNVAYINIFGLCLIFFFMVPQVLMLVFSYVQIARVCRKLSKESQQNALKTCIPHLLSILNYTVGSLFEIIQSRFNMSYFALEARIFLSLYFIVIPTITNPVLYGLGTQLVRIQIFKLFIKYKIVPTKIIVAVTGA